jgi:hypothetical protein
MLFSKYKYDVFISHAVEDKLIIANELFKRLEEASLSIWYSGRELKVGDSIEESIRRNLSLSRYAVVIFSQHYLSKNWTMKELYLLLGHEIAKRKVILPILLDVTVADLAKKDIAIADKFAIPFEKGMDYIVEKLLEEIKGTQSANSQNARRNAIKKIGVGLGAMVLILIMTFFGITDIIKSAPEDVLIEQTIQQRIALQKGKIERTYQLQQSESNAKAGTQKDVESLFAKFSTIKSYYRNEYEFANGYKEFRSKKNVEGALRTSIDALTPYNAYGFTKYEIALSPVKNNGQIDLASYNFINQEPVTHSITSSRWLENGDYQVSVTYTNNIRSVFVNLIFPAADFPKRYQVSISGFLPVENYVFRLQEGAWTFSAIQ